jgi:CubicO group peptidase (beta-lactamase class C family)
LFKALGIWRDPASRFTWQQDPDGAHTWHGDALWDEQRGYLWKVDPQGYSTGSFGAHFTAREMAKLGYLYLNDGIWEGQQIVPEAYVVESTRQHSEGGWPIFWPYGYLWWLPRHGNAQAFVASGFGSKLIYSIPELDLVVTTVASTEEARAHPQQEEEIRQLVPHFILPAVTLQ